jgi:hypothetical protein
MSSPLLIVSPALQQLNNARRERDASTAQARQSQRARRHLATTHTTDQRLQDEVEQCAIHCSLVMALNCVVRFFGGWRIKNCY